MGGWILTINPNNIPCFITNIGGFMQPVQPHCHWSLTSSEIPEMMLILAFGHLDFQSQEPKLNYRISVACTYVYFPENIFTFVCYNQKV